MADQTIDTRTEIIEAARTQFFTHGYEGTRLQNISDNVGVTKAMIHYYFNTKKELFIHVYGQSVREIFGGLDEVIEKDIPLFKKIEELVEVCLQKSASHPEILAFVITETSRKPDWLRPVFEQQIQLELDAFGSELDDAAANYKIASVDPQNLLLNIFSLCYYPVLSAGINEVLLNTNIDASKDTKHINTNGSMERKGIVLDTILNWLTA